MKKILLLLFTFNSIVMVYSQNESKKLEKAKEFSSISNQIYEKDYKNEILNLFKLKYKNIPESFWKENESLFNVEALIEKNAEFLCTIYSEAEIEELTKFYKSDLGKKMLSNIKPIMEGIQNNTKYWMIDLNKKVNLKLKEAGLLKSPPTEN